MGALLYLNLMVLFVISSSESVAGSVIPSYDTIVIGLGSAGTTAASTLARAGKRVLALEAQGCVGGRVRTETFGDGIVELGAEWIYGLHPSRVYDLAIQNNVSVILQELPFHVYRADGSKEDVTLTELLNYCFEVIDETPDKPESLGELVDRKLRQYLAVKYPQLINDEAFVRSFLDLANEVVNTLDASSDFHDVTTASSYVDLEGSKYGSWHRHGYRTFFEILLNTYKNGSGLPTLDMKLNKEVTNIQWSQQSTGSVVVTCLDGEQYTATNVIVTVSLGVLKERHSSLFLPSLPQEKVAAIDLISMGVLDKIVLSFATPWPAEPSLMFYWSAEDREKLSDEEKWLTKIAGSSPPAGSSNTLTLWIAGNNAKFMETLPEEVVQRRVIELLQRFVGGDVSLPQPTAVLRSTWFSNKFTRGSYSYDNVQMPGHPNIRQDLASPLLDAAGAPRVLFAGEATNPTHYGTVHGASDSGYREAQRILAHKG